MNRVSNIINAIAAEFHQIFASDADLLLFGSRVNNTANAYSDIDLAIQHQQTLDVDKMRQFQRFVDQIPTLYSIDLVDMDNASAALKQQIQQHSIQL